MALCKRGASPRLFDSVIRSDGHRALEHLVQRMRAYTARRSTPALITLNRWVTSSPPVPTITEHVPHGKWKSNKMIGPTPFPLNVHSCLGVCVVCPRWTLINVALWRFSHLSRLHSDGIVCIMLHPLLNPQKRKLLHMKFRNPVPYLGLVSGWAKFWHYPYCEPGVLVCTTHCVMRWKRADTTSYPAREFHNAMPSWTGLNCGTPADP